MTENELLKKRFVELANRSYNAGIYTFTDFLGLMEQSLFAEARREIGAIPFTAWGGVEGAERVMIRFGSEESHGYTEPFPIKCIKVEPLVQKFADKLNHRDFLGAIMNLGIERSTIGDIVIRDNVGYVLAKEDVAEYILQSLSRIRHTDIKASIVDELPDGVLFTLEARRIQLSSERIDAVVSKVFSLSRSDAQALFAKGLVFANGRLIESTSYTPKPEECISVRGYGRLIYHGPVGLTKKGKLNVDVELYV